MNSAAVYMKKANVIRVDKNLSENSLTWFERFGGDAALCFDIILYISNNAQKDIFNYGWIDLNHFCKTMGYIKRNLQKTADVPAQTDLHNKGNLAILNRDKKFITVFENALYKLGIYNIPVTTSTFDAEKNEYVLATKFAQIIKEVRIHIQNPDKPFSKISYSYITSEEFDYNLSRFFFFTDLNLVKELREKKLLLLYFYLKNIENMKHLQFVEQNFDRLCDFAGIHVNNENIKYTKKNLQTRKLSPMKQFIEGFDFQPINVSGKWKYGYAFTFEANKKHDKTADITVIKEATVDHANVKLLQYFRKKYKVLQVDEATFKEWLYDCKRDYEQKIDIYQTVFSRLYKMPKERFLSDAKRYFTRPADHR